MPSNGGVGVTLVMFVRIFCPLVEVYETVAWKVVEHTHLSPSYNKKTPTFLRIYIVNFCGLEIKYPIIFPEK
jgi:hypothetical protein